MTVPPIAERRKPGLSLTLPYPRRLDTCQGCGSISNELTLPHKKWRECDEHDQPTRIVVVLCARCSKQLIDPHPKLYVAVDEWEPVPGVMALCVGCPHQTALACLSPLLKANGGPGMEVKYPAPIRGFLCGRRTGGPFALWVGPPTSCSGREEAR